MSRAPREDRGRALRIVHHHPGRIRVRAVRFENDEGAICAVRDALLALSGVREVRHASKTGSLLIVYEPLLTDTNAIVTSLVELTQVDDVVDEVNGVLTASHLRHEIFAGTRKLDDVVLELTGGRIDLQAVVAGMLLAGSAYAFFAKPKDDRVPRWDNLLWWSYNFLSEDVHEVTRNLSG